MIFFVCVGGGGGTWETWGHVLPRPPCTCGYAPAMMQLEEGAIHEMFISPSSTHAPYNQLNLYASRVEPQNQQNIGKKTVFVETPIFYAENFEIQKIQ